MTARRVKSIMIGGGLVLIVLTVAAPQARAGRDCNNTGTGLVPLNDLGRDTYQGEMGGLYPGGSNQIPTAHLKLGLEAGEQVVPRSEDGIPNSNGRIVMISVGVSNTLAEFAALKEMVSDLPTTNNALVLVNGAQRGRALEQWSMVGNESSWNRVDRNLRSSGVTPDQVQIAWIMLPSEKRGPATLEEARANVERLIVVLQTAKRRYPNLELAYFSSRIYGGYIDDQNSEPNAYNHGFEVKWLIEDQIDGSAALNADPDYGIPLAPWIGWGPYLWADGVSPRSDGLTWECNDLAADGVHPGQTGSLKVATQLMDHFSTDPTATSWFLDAAHHGSAGAPVLPATSTTTTSSDRQKIVTSDRSDRPRQSPDSTRTQNRPRSGVADDEARPTGAPASGNGAFGSVVGVALAGLTLGLFAASSVRHRKRNIL